MKLSSPSPLVACCRVAVCCAQPSVRMCNGCLAHLGKPQGNRIRMAQGDVCVNMCETRQVGVRLMASSHRKISHAFLVTLF